MFMRSRISFRRASGVIAFSLSRCIYSGYSGEPTAAAAAVRGAKATGASPVTDQRDGGRRTNAFTEPFQLPPTVLSHVTLALLRI